jgi:RNA polymerase sigma factor (sigma-70 family)
MANYLEKREVTFNFLVQAQTPEKILIEDVTLTSDAPSMPVESLADLPERHLDLTCQLYDRLLKSAQYRCTIEKIARKNTRGSSLSWEDAVQTAHEKIMLAIQSGKFQYGSVEEFYRWSTTIARCTVIDLIRREKLRRYSSLDTPIADTGILIIETIADPFDLWDSVEQADLLLKINAILQTLDEQYPNRGYLKLWEGKILGKRQMQLASELNVKQGTVSKRWKELTRAVVAALELSDMKISHQKLRQSY